MSSKFLKGFLSDQLLASHTMEQYGLFSSPRYTVHLVCKKGVIFYSERQRDGLSYIQWPNAYSGLSEDERLEIEIHCLELLESFLQKQK